MGSVTYAQLADSNKSELFKNGDVVYCTDTQETYLYSNSTLIKLPKEENLNNKHKKMLPYPSNCKNCGAVMTGYICKFCGTHYPEFIIKEANNDSYN